jgi:hypothetical protein
MRRMTWVNALLAAAVAALAALAWFKPAVRSDSEHAVSTLKANTVTSIHIERPGSPPIELAKQGGAWRLIAPLSARADEARVQRLLDIAGARSAHKLAAPDLARFELDRPQARVTLGRQAFDFGMVNAVTREQYLRTEGAVYALDPRLGAAIPATAGDLISRRLLDDDETPVRITLRDFAVEIRDGKWVLSGTAAGGLSQDDLIVWVDRWRLASAQRVEPDTAAKPQSVASLQLKNGRTLALGIIAREPGLVLTRGDEKLAYTFGADAAKRLLSPPGPSKN